ncbi:uncharacterized protein LACBIDRAFT_307320 [Laccaria bicolor S238N-H82]|uniref:Predicted protein n=1 Tax=Laccaria bicolor (strain S238N-H82 / ATCC MYA-4686) TaxID=486041 RepID=B0DPW2_LACBS|nr:uncharacterized protein LACBIDRAFT_307320 [Laccaria bicolor S238N-H82]EDR03525.1 predicted protein [Laccaria bicolor S238N-H82]|eukprot:XP_001885981.1 predicted protein [Laccaria bicolor S238N-H82]
MPGVDSSLAASASAYPHASDQTIVGYILIALIIFAAMALIFRSLFKLVKAARRLDKADLKSAAAVAASEGELSTSSTSAGAAVGNHNAQHLTHRLKSAIPRRWDDIDDKLDEFERLTVKYYGNAKRYAVRTLQNMGVLEKAADEEGGIASDSHSKANAKAKWRLTAGYFNKTASTSSQHQDQDQRQQPEDPANTTTDSDLELDLEDTSIVKLPSLDLSSTPTLPYQPQPSKEHPTTPTHKEVRRITAIDILEALAKVGRLSLSLNTTYTEKMDSLLPRVSRDSKASFEHGNTNMGKANTKEWRRLTALDYLSKFVTSAVPTDRNKPLPHRPISVVGSMHSSVSVEDVVIGPPPPLALAVISEEDLEGGGAYETSACQDDDGKQADSETEKDASALPVPVARAPSTHRRSMTLPLQQAQPHLNLASGLSPSPSSSLSPSSTKAGEKLSLQLQLQAEKDGQVVSESDENTTTTEDSELRPTSDIPHITALAELAASIVGEHPDAPPILERVASLSLPASSSLSPLPYSLPLFVDPTSLSLSLDPTSTPLQNQNYNHQAAPSKFAWAGNTHRTTFGLITRANVPPTPPRLAMFVGSSGDGGDVGFRSNAGSVVNVRVVGTGREKSLGADTGIVLVQTTSLDLGRGAGVGVRGSANGGRGGNGNVDANRNSQAHVNGNANANGSRNSNVAASPTGNLLPLANTNANATTSPDANVNSAVTGPELLEKIKEAMGESQNEGQVGKGGQIDSEGQVEDDQLRKEGQVEQQEGLLAKDGPVEKEEQVMTGHVAGKTATGGTIGKTSTPAHAGTTTSTGKPSAPTQTPRPSASIQINSRQSTPVQSARLAVPLRPTRGKENRYVAGEPPRSVRRPPSQLRNVLCAI